MQGLVQELPMTDNQTMNRRDFLYRTTMIGGGLVAAPFFVSRASGRPLPSERITVGAIGISNRGRYVLNAFMQNADVQVVAVCDVIRGHRQRAKQMVDSHYDNSDCTAYIDMRELLARPDIDAVMIATGDNNHAPASLLAARAGKDIFCEKPSSVTIAESRAVAQTVRRFGRIYQCGTQRRNIGNFVFAVNLARSGRLGQLHTVHAEKHRQPSGVHFTVLEGQPEPEYERLAWDLWLGPAAWRPFNVRYTQRGFWIDHGDFAGGSITEWGTHTVDLCQWAVNADDTMPVTYEPINTQGDVEAVYANGVKLIIRKGLRFGTCPVRFEGDEGWVETGDSGRIEAHPASLLAERRFQGGYPADDHVREFLNCVKTRQQPSSNADVAHHSIAACHCANISVRLNRPLRWDPATEAFVDDDDANRLRSRAYREPWLM